MNVHLWRTGRGTRILLGRLRRWIGADSFGRGILRTLGTASGVFVVGGILLAAPILCVIALPVWWLTAWATARHLTPRQRAATGPVLAPEPQPESPRQVLTFEQATAVLRCRIQTLIGTANGVHLDVLLKECIDDGQLTAETTVADLRRDLTLRGIPTRSSLKVGGAVRVGVHRDDLPAVAQPLPEAALDLAG